MQKKYKCFLFDLDGTLLDTAPEFLISLNSLLKKNKMHLVSDSFVRIRVSDGVGRLVQDSFKINEDHSEFENLRNKLFGQYDHLRLYGPDYYDKLIKVGFKVEKIDQTQKMDKSLIRKYGLIKGEIIPFCKKV